MAEFRSIHIRTLSGWRALVAGGLVLALIAVLAFLTFGLFLLLVPVAAAIGLASIFLPRRRRAPLDRMQRTPRGVIETDYRVISEESMPDGNAPPSRDENSL